MAALSAKAPPRGSIDAIGWTTLEGLKMPASTLMSCSALLRILAAWMLTIDVCTPLLIGSEKKRAATAKGRVILFQFLMVIPLFILGGDFCRWIFLWFASVAPLHAFLSSPQELDCMPFGRAKTGVGV